MILSLQDLLPHRDRMSLLSRAVHVADDEARAEIDIDKGSSFYLPGRGVPACIGIEYMGQTAALIAGRQLVLGTLTPHTGLLLGSRRFNAAREYFTAGERLDIQCRAVATAAGGLASFQGEIRTAEGDVVADGMLSVLRQPLDPEDAT